MKVTLFGAAGTVTGSAYYVECRNSSVLVDFGVFQGEKEFESDNMTLPPVDIKNLNAVIITHAHLDHTGRLPLLVKGGFRGPIYATPATIDIAGIILKDSANMQAFELKKRNRRLAEKGEQPLEATFDETDVLTVMSLMTPLPYNSIIKIAPDISARVKEAGHLLGSVSIELTCDENHKKTKVLFSGDLGRQNTAILKDPDPFHSADLVFMESTYGDREHKPMEETLKEAREIIIKAIEKKGKILVPSFAIGRAQQILYYITRAVHRGNLPEIPVYLDSPMAIEATRIYVKHPELFDEEAEKMLSDGVVKGDLSRLNLSVSAEESKALNSLAGPCMIMAGAGMCNAGRIVHHLRNNLQSPDTTVLIIGYQGPASLGRRLISGDRTVRIFGEEIEVNANIATLGGFSAHAGKTDLISWFDHIAPSKPRLVLTHGETKARQSLADAILEKYNIAAQIPEYGETITL